jgi:hypothetical protein
MSRDLDALTSSTLKHLREFWWDDAFTAFLGETLRPRPGRRILDVGCGNGTAELSLARLRLSQMHMFGVDLIPERVRDAHKATRGINVRVGYAAADACRLPFAAGVFDSTYCVAVLQHIRDLAGALGEIARVTKPGGRVLVVEPDNTARYWFSSLPSGMDTFEIGRRFFSGLGNAREKPCGGGGPARAGAVRSDRHRADVRQPLSRQHRASRRTARDVVGIAPSAVREAIAKAPGESLRRLGADYLKAIDHTPAMPPRQALLRRNQNTMLFATVGQRNE